MVGVVVAVIAGVYFFLLSDAKFPEPSSNLTYDVDDYIKLDQIETRFEESASLDPRLDSPRAMAIGPKGNLHVVGKDEVAVFNEDGEETNRFAIEGYPMSIGIAPDGEILLGIEGKVHRMSPKGEQLAVWDDLDKRAYISSIAANDEDVFIADANNRVVYRYTRDGEFVNRIGEKDPDRDIEGLLAPGPYLDLAFDMHGTLWVVNPGLLGLESYRDNGDIISYWYKPPPDMSLESFSGCCNPVHIAFNSEGKLVTSEKGLVRIKMYEVSQGIFEELVVGSSLFPKYLSVKDLAVDKSDRILALDPRQDIVRIFELKDETDGRETD